MGIVDILRSKVYQSFFGPQNPVSTQWAYDAILKNLPDEASLLDIGCGDGIYFTNPVVIETIIKKRFKIFAIDIDAGAITICQKRIAAAGLQEYIHATAMSVTDVKEKYDFVLWMESFPVISPKLFNYLFSHSLTLAKKKVLLYHNLVPDEEATPFWRKLKPMLLYFTLVDFGRLTTLSEMRQCMQSLTDKPFTIRPLLQCKLSEMHILAGIGRQVLDLFHVGGGDRQIIQYLTEVDFE
mmetsp:Transcript_12161/g.14695  ORF Transcript_12161/g.14695 Transcript_12161/m.14695 type:complete len:239 (+) Transcript_12161:98-814(+)